MLKHTERGNSCGKHTLEHPKACGKTQTSCALVPSSGQLLAKLIRTALCGGHRLLTATRPLTAPLPVHLVFLQASDLRSLVEQLCRGVAMAPKLEDTPDAQAEEPSEASWQSATNDYRRAQYGSVWPGAAPRKVPVHTMSANIYRQPGPGQKSMGLKQNMLSLSVWVRVTPKSTGPQFPTKNDGYLNRTFGPPKKISLFTDARILE